MWREIKRYDPAGWGQVVEVDQAIRNGLPKVRGQAYLHHSLQPIEEVNFGLHHPAADLSMFENECEGMCGL